MIELIPPLQQKVRDHELWACHLGPELGGPGYGQVKLALLNEILGRSRLAPIVFGCQAPDSGNAEILAHYGTAGAEGASTSQPLLERRDRLLLLDDRAAGRRRPDGVHHPGRARRRRVGDQRREVVLVERPLRRVPDRDGGHRPRGRAPTSGMSMFIVPTDTPGVEIIRNVGVGHRARGGGHPRLHPLRRTCACRPTTCSASEGRRS